MLKSLFNNVAGLQTRNFIKKRFQHRCFPVNFAKLLKATFFTEHFRWLLLYLGPGEPLMMSLESAFPKYINGLTLGVGTKRLRVIDP